MASRNVRFVLTRGLTEPKQDTKTEAGECEVKLLPPALEALQAQKTFTFLKNEEVFQNPKTGERWMGPNPIGLMWASALRKTKVRYRNQYQTGIPTTRRCCKRVNCRNG